MPLYEYRCESCGHEFEELQKFSDKPIKKCPECRALKVKRLVSKTSFQLKGEGWYVTDYARKGKEGDSGSNGKSKKTEGSKSSEKSEAKPKGGKGKSSDKASARTASE